MFVDIALYYNNQERIKMEEEERVTAHPGCGLGESVAWCLNILFTVDSRLTVRCSSGCHPLTTGRWLANLELISHTHVSC